MGIDWKAITPTDFEELCYLLAEFNGFTSLQWYGKGGGDKGRDIVAQKDVEYTKRDRASESWVIQCKRYTSQPPSVPQISAFLEQCREHKPDHVLIILSNTLSSGTKDWVASVRQDYKFRIHLWEEIDLINEMQRHRKSLPPKYAKLLSQAALSPDDPVYLFQTPLSTVHYIVNNDEFEEMGIFIINDYGHKRNIEYIKSFIEYLRGHDVLFDEFDEEYDDDESA
jgi:hypothetical protein